MNSEINFIVGTARGGTSFLTDVLDDFFDFGTAPEGTFIQPLFKRRASYGDLNSDEALKQLTTDISRSEMMRIMRHSWPEPLQIDVTPEAIFANVRARTFAGVVYAAFETVAQLRGKTHVCSKDPSSWKYLGVLDQLFGSCARYICIVRDGRDVACSLSKTRWGEKSAYLVAKRWSAFLYALAQLESQVGAAQVYKVRYEDFISDPDFAITFLEEALGTGLPTANRERALLWLETHCKKKNYNKWKNEMNARDAAVFEAVAGNWLHEYGYERTGQTVNPGVSELLKIHSMELVRKAYLTVRKW